MFIRRKRNKSGTYSVQVISKFDGRYKLEMSFGSSSDEKILKDLEYRASEWIAQYRGQTVIDFSDSGCNEDLRLTTEGVLDAIDKVLLNGPHLILSRIYDSIGFDRIEDGKTSESQVVLGLLVSRNGYPLSYSLFNGSQFEGRTMLPIVDDFVQRFNLTDFVVVSDAGLMSRKNIALLKSAGYKFILGGRIKKEAESVKDWLFSLKKVNGCVHQKPMANGERLIVGYSEKRAEKDALNRKKGIDRLEKAYKSGKVSKRNINQRGYNKFLKIENDVAVSIDYGKIGEDAQWDGWKSYVTNTDFPPEEVISLYRELWVVERAFRISKGTLEMRPIFHFTEKRIESHVCICFVAYKLYKELERVIQMMNLGLSVDAVIDIAKTVPTLVLELPDGQMITRTIFNTRDQQLIRPLFPNS